MSMWVVRVLRSYGDLSKPLQQQISLSRRLGTLSPSFPAKRTNLPLVVRPNEDVFDWNRIEFAQAPSMSRGEDYFTVPGSIYGLFVGIDAYPEEVGPLQFCSTDATELHDFFARHTAPENLKLLVHPPNSSGASTRAHILTALTDFSTRRAFTEEDVFIFFFAGHGLNVDRQYYLLTSDLASKPVSSQIIDFTAHPALLNACSLPIKLLQEFVDEITTGNQVLIIDACRDEYSSRSPFNSSIDDAAGQAKDALDMHFREGNEKLILLLSDGADWRAEQDIRKGVELVAASSDPALLAESLHYESDIRFYSVAISNRENVLRYEPRHAGKPQFVPNVELLQQISNSTDGLFFNQPNAGALAALLDDLGQGVLYHL
jgi:hypothetical protein